MQPAPNTTERTFTVLLRSREPPHVEHVVICVDTFGDSPEHPATLAAIERFIEAADLSGFDVINAVVCAEAEAAFDGVDA